MKPIRHLISIVFLLCGLTALGRERGYDRNDLDRYVVKVTDFLLISHIPDRLPRYLLIMR